jgi:hypothetical protein
VNVHSKISNYSLYCLIINCCALLYGVIVIDKVLLQLVCLMVLVIMLYSSAAESSAVVSCRHNSVTEWTLHVEIVLFSVIILQY